MVDKDATLKAVDFFCGAGGMSFGLAQSGIQVLAGIDNSADCEDTYTKNIPNAQYLRKDITELSETELTQLIGITPDDPNLIFCGCSPCQFWSKIRTDKTKSEKTAFLLKQFERFIKHFNPGYIVIENVPGLFRNLNYSILHDFTSFLKELGYSWKDGIINASHYGVPQNRLRYLLIASKTTRIENLPQPEADSSLCVQNFLGEENGFARIHAGHRDHSDFQHTTMSLSEKNLHRLALTPRSGGTRRAWSKDPTLQIAAYREKDKIFQDVYGRMAWDKPAPTITTKFLSLSNGRFGHPEEDRALSVREGATLQTFPKSYRFYGTALASLGRQIGNAVPPALSCRIGHHIKSVHSTASDCDSNN